MYKFSTFYAYINDYCLYQSFLTGKMSKDKLKTQALMKNA